MLLYIVRPKKKKVKSIPLKMVLILILFFGGVVIIFVVPPLLICFIEDLERKCVLTIFTLSLSYINILQSLLRFHANVIYTFFTKDWGEAHMVRLMSSLRCFEKSLYSLCHFPSPYYFCAYSAANA